MYSSSVDPGYAPAIRMFCCAVYAMILIISLLLIKIAFYHEKPSGWKPPKVKLKKRKL